MTVDFGWPLWGFTAIALAVVAACALLFVLVHEQFPRGVLGTLLLEGVVIAAVAPAVMASSKPSTPAMSASPLTRTEFAQRADANCRALAQHLASLGNPKTLPGITRKLDVVIPAFSMALRAQGALRPPAGEEDLATQWMRGMARYGNELTSLRAAANSGDGAAVAKANQRVGAVGGQDGRLSKQLGLSYCFQ